MYSCFQALQLTVDSSPNCTKLVLRGYRKASHTPPCHSMLSMKNDGLQAMEMTQQIEGPELEPEGLSQRKELTGPLTSMHIRCVHKNLNEWCLPSFLLSRKRKTYWCVSAAVQGQRNLNQAIQNPVSAGYGHVDLQCQHGNDQRIWHSMLAWIA